MLCYANLGTNMVLAFCNYMYRYNGLERELQHFRPLCPREGSVEGGQCGHSGGSVWVFNTRHPATNDATKVGGQTILDGHGTRLEGFVTRLSYTIVIVLYIVKYQ